MNKTLLIVGGTGVISYAVVLESLKKGFSVTCINRGITNTQQLPKEVNVINCDYKKKDEIETLLNGKYFDAIIDVLCSSPSDIDYSVDLFIDKCKQYIFFSSCAVYNKGNGDYECNEDSMKINPVWSYSVNKWKCEERLVELADRLFFNYTIIRPAVTYGNTRIPYGITPIYGYHGTLIHRILKGKPIITWDCGKAYSTITRVEDFAIGLVGLIGNPKSYNQSYNVVGDERYMWIEVLDTIGKILNVQPIYFNLTKEEYASELPNRKGEILGGRGVSQLLDNTKLKQIVPEMKTNISLEEGLRMTIDYYMKNDYLKGIDWVFDADTDRIIFNFCKKKGISTEGMKLGFIDYLGNATMADRCTYWIENHKDNLAIKVLKKIIMLLSKVIFKLKKSIN